MNRRDVLRITSAISLAGIASAALADEQAPAGRDAHPAAAGGHDHAADLRYADLVAATSRCAAAGDACLSHCLMLLGQGDKELANCAKTVRDTIAVCTALRQLAAADSPHMKALGKVTSAICADCEEECKKHEKHAVCRDCAKACRDCKDLCDKLATAA